MDELLKDGEWSICNSIPKAIISITWVMAEVNTHCFLVSKNWEGSCTVLWNYSNGGSFPWHTQTCKQCLSLLSLKLPHAVDYRTAISQEILNESAIKFESAETKDPHLAPQPIFIPVRKFSIKLCFQMCHKGRSGNWPIKHTPKVRCSITCEIRVHYKMFLYSKRIF